MRSRAKRWLFESRAGDRLLAWLERLGLAFDFHGGRPQLCRVRLGEEDRIRAGGSNVYRQ